MRSANLSLTAGSLPRRTTNKAAVLLSEERLLRLATVILLATLLFTGGVLWHCDDLDSDTMSVMSGEVRHER